MEKLEYEITRDFIVDLGNFLEDKNPKNFNWEFIRDKYYIFEGENFSNIRELEWNARCIKDNLTENSSNPHGYIFGQLNIKYLIKIYQNIKNTEFIKDFDRVISDCYFKIFKNTDGWKNEDNTLYIEDVKVLEFLDNISSENMSDKQKEIASEWGVTLNTHNLENLKEIAEIIKDDENFKIRLNWKNLSEAREIVFDI